MEMVQKIKEFFNEDQAGWIFSIGMTICMILSFVEIPVFICLFIALVWFAITSIRSKDPKTTPTKSCLLFLAGSVWAQLLMWLM